MNLIATEVQINTEDIIAFTTKTQRHNCFFSLCNQWQMNQWPMNYWT